MRNDAPDAAGLYVHVPFCTSVCPYCDFAVTIAGSDRRAAYVQGVVREARGVRWTGGDFDTVYLGGGTPSSLDMAQLENLLASLRIELPVRSDARITLEANPEDVTADRVAAWRAAGVTAVSLGVQSFRDDELRFLGRRHDARTARRALGTLVDAGLDWVSVDLIFGLPEQMSAAWRSSLAEAAASGATHLSCYELTVHDGTVFGRRAARGELHSASEEAQSELFDLAHRRLDAAGWAHYEVSSWAAGDGHRSRHNLKYWRHLPYLGLGPSAHSFDGDRMRWWNHRGLRHWQRAVDGDASPVEGSERLSDEQLLLETVLLGLRTSDGLDVARLERRFGFDLVACNQDLLDRLLALHLVELSGGLLVPTPAGMAVAEGIVRALDLQGSETAASPSS